MLQQKGNPDVWRLPLRFIWWKYINQFKLYVPFESINTNNSCVLFFSIDSHIKCNTNDKREPTKRTSTDGAIPVYLFTFLDETNWLGIRMFNLIWHMY